MMFSQSIIDRFPSVLDVQSVKRKVEMSESEVKSHKNPEKFARLVKELPKPGTIIETYNGEAIEMFIRTDGFEYTVSARIAIDPDVTGWYLTQSNRGVVVFLSRESQEELKDNKGRLPQTIAVSQLRVKAQTRTGRAIICDLLEE